MIGRQSDLWPRDVSQPATIILRTADAEGKPTERRVDTLTRGGTTPVVNDEGNNPIVTQQTIEAVPAAAIPAGMTHNHIVGITKGGEDYDVVRAEIYRSGSHPAYDRVFLTTRRKAT